MNPGVLIGGPILFVWILWLRRDTRRTGRAHPRTLMIIFALLMIYFVARNVPSPTTSPLAPPPPAIAQ